MDLNAWFSGQSEYFLLLEVLMLTSAISACRLVQLGRVHIFEFPLLEESLKWKTQTLALGPKANVKSFCRYPIHDLPLMRTLRRPVKKKEENNSLSAVLKDFQLASVQFCPVKLGDGILHVAAWCKLDHPELRARASVRTEVRRSGDTRGVWRHVKKNKTESHPSFLLGLCASTKVTSPAFLIRSFRSCCKPQRRLSDRANTLGCLAFQTCRKERWASTTKLKHKNRQLSIIDWLSLPLWYAPISVEGASTEEQHGTLHEQGLFWTIF